MTSAGLFAESLDYTQVPKLIALIYDDTPAISAGRCTADLRLIPHLVVILHAVGMCAGMHDAGRDVHIWQADMCAYANHTAVSIPTFCQAHVRIPHARLQMYVWRR